MILSSWHILWRCRAIFSGAGKRFRPAGSRRMGMDFAMAGIDHQPFVIGIVDQDFQQLFPNPGIPPPDKTAVHVAPPAQIWQPIAPRRARAQNPETALINKRLSFSTPPHTPSRPGRCGSSNVSKRRSDYRGRTSNRRTESASRWPATGPAAPGSPARRSAPGKRFRRSD